MSRDILGEYGPESSRGSSPSGLSRPKPRETMNWMEPKGPTGRYDTGPGLHTDLSRKGSQGPATTHDGTSGSVGLGGQVHKFGSQGCDY